jgi:tRNA(Ile)-lysidine synthase
MDLDRLRAIAQQECRLSLDRPLLAGVSGGPDSLCLLDSLARLGFSLVVAHFDHRLRPESSQDAQAARRAAERWQFPFLLGSRDVAGYAAGERLSIEEAARELRYRFLFGEARRCQAQAVAVGHTADDQVETVLMHLLRGAGLAGLAGMDYHSKIAAWDADLPLVRPLLSFWRSETAAYCREQSLEAVTDASNQDQAFLRNRLRLELIPFLETYNPQVRPALWRMSRVLAGEEAVVRAVVEQAWDACQPEARAGAVVLSLPVFRALAVGLQRGVLRRAAAHLLPGLRDFDFAAADRALRFLEFGAAGQVDLARGLRLFAEGDRLVIASGEASPSPEDWPQLGAWEAQALVIPGQVELAGGWRLAGAWAGPGDFPGLDALRAAGRWEAWLDADALPGSLSVRPPLPGDRFRPLGMEGHSVRLSDFWINHKLPRRARAAWPLVIAGKEIVWAPGFRPAHPVRLRENTRQALHLRLFRVLEEG